MDYNFKWVHFVVPTFSRVQECYTLANVRKGVSSKIIHTEIIAKYFDKIVN